MPQNKPIKQFKVGCIRASIWKKEEVQKNNSIKTKYSVKIQKQYKDKSGRWQNTYCYFPEDLLKLLKKKKKASEYVMLKENGSEK